MMKDILIQLTERKFHLCFQKSSTSSTQLTIDEIEITSISSFIIEFKVLDIQMVNFDMSC